MTIVVFWIIFGGLAGWIAALLNEKSNTHRTLASIVLGIVGALIGGAIMLAVGGVKEIEVKDFVIPVAFSIVTLMLVSSLAKRLDK